MHFTTEPLQTLPAIVRAHVAHQLHLLEEALQTQSAEITAPLADARVQQQIVPVLVASDYVATQLQRYPRLFADLVQSQDLWQHYDDSVYLTRLTSQLRDVNDENDAMKILRQLRRREMVRIIWRDSTGLAPFAETARDLSNLADACVDQALAKLYEILAPA